jgi:hypothetical protein
MSENYFTFPLAVLQGNKPVTTASECLELAVRCGVLNAGIGFRKNNTHEEFMDRLDSIIEENEITWKVGHHSDRANVLVGASICNVSLGGTSPSHLEGFIAAVQGVPTGGAFVKMASKYLWPAVYQARAGSGPRHAMARAWNIVAGISNSMCHPQCEDQPIRILVY